MRVDLISRDQARWHVEDVHYAHRMPQTRHLFGLFDDDDELVGVVTYGNPATPQVRRSVLGSDKANLLELNRLVVTTNAANAASQLVGASLRLLPSPCVVVSYADGGANHVGYIYQATNFFFAGSAKSHDNEYIWNGRKYHSRTLSRMGIKAPVKWAKEVGADTVEPSQKNRYVFLVGSKAQKRDLANRVQWELTKNYPKGGAQHMNTVSPRHGLPRGEGSDA